MFILVTFCFIFAVQLPLYSVESKNIDLALSYDDVLLVPQKTEVLSRKNVSTQTWLTKNITLSMPIVSANMDTITESEMAITMAQLGGIGIIHRFNTIDEQVQEVLRVKRYRNAIISNPITINQNSSLAQAKKLMSNNKITSLLNSQEYPKAYQAWG